MTDPDALYRAILAAPDDDTLRLVYADAVEEAGDPRRAAFIRTQVQLAHVPDWDPAWVRVRHHERDLMPGAWARDLPALPDGLDWARDPFRRGLPAHVEVEDAGTFLTHADDLFEQYPVEALVLRNSQLSTARQFAASPWVGRLVRLAITQGMGAPTARWLLGATHYERLRELHIGAVLTTTETATAVVRSRMFRQLTTLSCRDDRAGGQTLVNELTRLADPPQLKVLDLSGNRLDPERMARLVAAPALAAVEELDLSDNNLRAESLQALAAARLPHLKSLHLLRTHPEGQGVAAVARAGFLPQLRSLSLGGCYLNPPSAVALVRTAAVANLRVLDLRENALGDRGATTLANSPHLKNLVHLDLASNLIEDAGANALAESPYLDGLIHLDLHGNLPTPAAAARLRKRFGDRVFL
ncbi:leucine-rich repeat-containing protein typical subtype : Leucine-rich repeat-containing protein typical subtype OS=Herpetosiphon aurantiacus (strain ATCC 23779 / DSM 785) GN=Haur_4051 PE=4 SV=1: LRR_7: LRR_6: LRR_6: LRR_6 [Gemmataceae bacterium]|nr:leucine-rich repeat-containing protein typical subtype : Leucine-rich repeat-containing protein typical subtype OS=Herpetosiphon aurantiacus (strain ATCC 23779 / DSM 785) GN=Haur_4051 PE=4 SV=1: LRR_7: LRR_6: LRR_6: LRR_6 [Gemmataceae bacterium]VTU01084.1 leucine-rich repeat-containing protein typical subtype : Leucine-rich repeat-containing protein typical subtype OS=Herpetosiphon aurantiacus (strain ATCC 23779 / DSM 785) GN=Haur_4051 PE=4 SV=1: LRR_7: LRR_6: LRR_6: LRR_6 [Gemmataceae bacteriu